MSKIKTQADFLLLLFQHLLIVMLQKLELTTNIVANQFILPKILFNKSISSGTWRCPKRIFKHLGKIGRRFESALISDFRDR